MFVEKWPLVIHVWNSWTIINISKDLRLNLISWLNWYNIAFWMVKGLPLIVRFDVVFHNN